MSWLPNGIQGSTKFSIVRVILDGNFTAIDTGFNNNHNALDAPRPGLHKWVTFPLQSGAPVLSVPQDIQLYAKDVAGFSQLFLQRDYGLGTLEYPITELEQNTDGFTTLPSGLLIKWGAGTVLANQAQTVQQINPPTPAYEPGEVYSWQITAVSPVLQHFLTVTNITDTDITVAHRTTSGATPTVNSSYRYVVMGLRGV